MIVKSQSGNVANSINAQCYRGKDEVDWRSWCPERGSVILVNFGDDKTKIDSEIKNIRPAIVLSNNMGNRYSSILTVVPLTSSSTKSRIPVHIKVGIEEGMRNPSLACLEQTTCVSKRRALIDSKFMIICKLSSKKNGRNKIGIKITNGVIKYEYKKED